MTSFRTVTYEGRDVSVPNPDYPYQPLNEDLKQFRLVSLDLRGDHEDDIRGSLAHYQLDGHQAYTALSYEWGDPSQVTWMYLDSNKFPITNNLADALRTLRSKECPVVWIDAICIDQCNEAEKAAHIPLMTDIYHEAESVCAWIGSEKDSSEKVMDILRAMDVSRKSSVSEKPWQPDTSLIQRYYTQIQAFFDRTYWRRVWIIQEISVASRIYLLCGSKLVSWSGLELFISWLHGVQIQKQKKARPTFQQIEDDLITEDMAKPVADLMASDSFRHISRLQRSRSHTFEGRPIGLLENVYQTVAAKATDPRDKVYALCGISFDKSRFVKAPSYTWTEAEMCLAMTKVAIQSKKSLDIILLGGLNSAENLDLKLPSWCPNYLQLSSASYSEVLCAYLSGHAERARLGTSRGRWQATRDSAATPGSVRYDDSQCLHTPGKRLCVIFNIGPRPDVDSVDQPVELDRDEQDIAEEVTAQAINEILILYANDYVKQSKQPRMLRYLFHYDDSSRYSSSQVKELERRFERTIRWRKLNEDLVIGKKTLKRTAKSLNTAIMAPDTTNYPLIEKFVKPFILAAIDGVAGSDSTPYSSPTVNHDRLIDPELVDTLHSLQDLIDEGLRLATMKDNFHVGWVHPDAQPGDSIYLLTGCSVPVVLRPHGVRKGMYTVIGHAYLTQVMDGSYWSSLSRSDLEEVVLC